MQKTNILYGIIGLLVGIIVVSGACFMNHHRDGRGEFNKKMHQMPDGSMMSESGMNMEMDNMMSELEGKTGDAFDKAFIDEMIMHHEGAVLMAQMALTSANHKEIKDMANAIISAQTKEINQMKSWKTIWFGN